MDLLAANQLGRAMHAALYDRSPAAEPPNFARYTFLDELYAAEPASPRAHVLAAWTAGEKVDRPV